MPLRKQWIVLLPCLALGACAAHPHNSVTAAATLAPQTQEIEPPLLVRDGDKVLPIERNRPLKPGDQYDVEGHSVFDVQVTLPAFFAGLATKGSRLESGAKHFDIAGRVQVVSLDSGGKPTAATFTVKTCTGADEEILPPGTVIDAKATPGGMTYTRRDGKRVTREVTQALLGVFNQEKGAGAPPRGKDGSDVPHNIGETWPVEAPPTTQRAVGDGSKASFTDLQGWTTLKSMKAMDGIQAVEVESGMKAVLHIENLPLGFKAEPANLEAGQTVFYPVDPAMLPLETDRHLATEIKVAGSFLFIPVSADVKVQMHQTITPVKRGS